MARSCSVTFMRKSLSTVDILSSPSIVHIVSFSSHCCSHCICVLPSCMFECPLMSVKAVFCAEWLFNVQASFLGLLTQCDVFGQAGEWWSRYGDGLLLRPLRIVDGSVSRNVTLSVVLLWLSISSEKRCVVYCSVIQYSRQARQKTIPRVFNDVDQELQPRFQIWVRTM